MFGNFSLNFICSFFTVLSLQVSLENPWKFLHKHLCKFYRPFFGNSTSSFFLFLRKLIWEFFWKFLWNLIRNSLLKLFLCSVINTIQSKLFRYFCGNPLFLLQFYSNSMHQFGLTEFPNKDKNKSLTNCWNWGNNVSYSLFSLSNVFTFKQYWFVAFKNRLPTKRNSRGFT